MNGALLQAKIYAGYAKAALRLGFVCSQYRPTAVTAAIVSGNLLGTLTAGFDAAADFSYDKPALHGKPLRYALVDGARVQPADYLVAPDATYFIAGMEPLLPIVAVICNATLSVLRPTPNASVGAQPYGGDIVANETPVLTAWPGSIVQGTKGEKGDTNLPGDIRMPWYSVLLPALPGGVQIETADVMTDSLGRRFKISSAELGALGWRLTAALAET